MNFFYRFFFHIYINMSRNWSAKYYQESKERLHKKLMKDIKVFLKEERKRNDNMVVNVTKTSQKMKNKSLLSIEKEYYRMKKMTYYNYQKLFQFRKYWFFIRKSIRKFFLFAYVWNALSNKQKMWKQIQEIFDFQIMQVPSWNVRILLGLELESPISQNITRLTS